MIDAVVLFVVALGAVGGLFVVWLVLSYLAGLLMMQELKGKEMSELVTERADLMLKKGPGLRVLVWAWKVSRYNREIGDRTKRGGL